MPDWDPEANGLFLRALEIAEPEDQKRFLDETCAAQPALRARVEALLRAHGRAGSFLGKPVLEPTGAPGPGAGATRTGPSAEGDVSLDFLAPSDKSGSLGRLGHYEVQAVVGRGGMGVVFKAFDESLHRVVAIKVMAPQLAAVATARQRFTREARAQAAVAHEHVVTIHAVEEANGLPYIAMQYVAGASLQDRLDRDGPLRLQEVLRIGVQVAQGLAAAHKQGLVHRDIKPANILLENGVERVKLTDFGLARAADDASLTASGQVAGTPMYMSPEQAEGKPVDARSDLFSLGSVLYAMCAGRPPFRAASTVAVLKRVCEDTPTPVREVNPEVPEWLADAIAKLHAKNPAQRFQSADEVAELLGAYLARVQRPSGVAERPTAKLARRRRRWAVTAAVLTLLAAGLATTEAAGVTRLRAAVARAFTPTAPAVAEGDSTTPQPQSGPAPGPVTPAVVPVVGSKPFVIPARDGQAERTFDTLTEAVQRVGNGDTIEVRGNGPFEQARIDLQDRAICIRAGTGFRPVFRSRLPVEKDWMIGSQSSLVLEGLTFQQLEPTGPPATRHIIWCSGSLYVANCRFVGARRGSPMLFTEDSARCEVRNCLLVGSQGLMPHLPKSTSTSRVILENNVILTPNWSLYVGSDPEANFHLRLIRNTLISGVFSINYVCQDLNPPVGGAVERPKNLRIDALHNIFDVGGGQTLAVPLPKPAKTDVELFQRRAVWEGNDNLFAMKARLFVGASMASEGLDGWRQIWADRESGSVEKLPRYLGGDLLAKANKTPELVEPEDFRLHPDSPGRGSWPDGKDFGADIDLVGPGPAYEEWKKTSDYQEWLKETGQAAVVPPANNGAFVVLGGKGVPERKFDTLAEAVRWAWSGDTIEVRGNGPFPLTPIRVTCALCIRAGEGFRPVFQVSPMERPSHPVFLPSFVEHYSRLVIEGLEFQQTVRNPNAHRFMSSIIHSYGPLYLANCRCTLAQFNAHPLVVMHRSPGCEICNCQVERTWIQLYVNFTSRFVLRNNVWLGLLELQPVQGCQADLQLIRNTFVGGGKFGPVRLLFYGRLAKAPPDPAGGAPKSLRVLASGNVFDGAEEVLSLELQDPPERPAEVWQQLTGWTGDHNLFAPNARLSVRHVVKVDKPLMSSSGLAEWKKFWDTTETGSVEGRPRYVGGDISAKADKTPAQIKPEDFRLHPDSPGRGAGPDGKDLGADIDLVGPGPAYEKWKKTPDYQQWLKHTGQK